MIPHDVPKFTIAIAIDERSTHHTEWEKLMNEHVPRAESFLDSIAGVDPIVMQAFDDIPTRRRMAILGLAPIRVDETPVEPEVQTMIDVGMFRREKRTPDALTGCAPVYLVRTFLADSYLQQVAEDAASAERQAYGIPSDAERTAEFAKTFALEERKTIAFETIAGALVRLVDSAEKAAEE